MLRLGGHGQRVRAGYKTGGVHLNVTVCPHTAGTRTGTRCQGIGVTIRIGRFVAHHDCRIACTTCCIF